MSEFENEAINNLNAASGSSRLGNHLFPPDILRGMRKNQKRKYLRYGKIPGKSSKPQCKSGVAPPEPLHSTRNISEGQIMDNLWAQSKLGDDAAQYLYKEIMKKKYPPHSRSFDTAQRFWGRIENSKVNKKGQQSLD